MRQQLGMFKHKFTVETPSHFVSPEGSYNTGEESDWTELGEVWGQLAQKETQEASKSDAVVNQPLYTLTIRHYPALTVDMRFKRGSDAYYITGITDPDNTQIWMVCDVAKHRALESE